MNAAPGQPVDQAPAPGTTHNPRPLLGAVEGGGTRIVCAVGTAADQVFERALLPTLDATTTVQLIVDFFRQTAARYGAFSGVGLAFFGPLNLRRDLTGYGRTLATPKPGWSDVDLITPIAAATGAPVLLDTDVNAAALAEWLGAVGTVKSVAYVTVGTGIGVGFAPDLFRERRLLHPEAGHIRVRRVALDDFPGLCPFHGDCLEGLASGSAIVRRWGCKLDDLPADHPGRELIADYLGQLAAAIALFYAVERIVFGGGVMHAGTLLPQVRAAARRHLGGYFPPLNGPDALERYICAPALGDGAGLAGAFVLARGQTTGE